MAARIPQTHLSSKQLNYVHAFVNPIYECPPSRAVASLMVPGGQDFQFPHFSSNFDQFDLFFLKFF